MDNLITSPVITTVFFFQFYLRCLVLRTFSPCPREKYIISARGKRAQGAGEVSQKLGEFKSEILYFVVVVVVGCCGWGWRTTVGTTLLFVSYICAIHTRYSYIVLFLYLLLSGQELGPLFCCCRWSSLVYKLLLFFFLACFVVVVVVVRGVVCAEGFILLSHHSKLPLLSVMLCSLNLQI